MNVDFKLYVICIIFTSFRESVYVASFCVMILLNFCHLCHISLLFIFSVI